MTFRNFFCLLCNHKVTFNWFLFLRKVWHHSFWRAWLCVWLIDLRLGFLDNLLWYVPLRNSEATVKDAWLGQLALVRNRRYDRGRVLMIWTVKPGNRQEALALNFDISITSILMKLTQLVCLKEFRLCDLGMFLRSLRIGLFRANDGRLRIEESILLKISQAKIVKFIFRVPFLRFL